MRVLKAAGLMTLRAVVAGCGTDAFDRNGRETTEGTTTATPAAALDEPGLILARAEDYTFTVPSTFPSGWVKLRFENAGEEDHFLLG